MLGLGKRNVHTDWVAWKSDPAFRMTLSQEDEHYRSLQSGTRLVKCDEPEQDRTTLSCPGIQVIREPQPLWRGHSLVQQETKRPWFLSVPFKMITSCKCAGWSFDLDSLDRISTPSQSLG
jgi:hypothetical protein